MRREVPFSPPNIGEEEIREVTDALRSDWITTGPRTREFESRFAEAVGAPAALALNSCTAGLHLALLAHGIGPGDRVATTPMTFAASVNVIEHVGATPLLVDVDPGTLNLSPAALEASLTPDVKAIIAVHYAGHPVDLDAIQAIARERGIPLIEDAAHALPARYKGATIGSHGNLAAYSFYATKNMTTGEGGMLTGPVDEIDRVRSLSLHGLSKDASRRYDKGGSWRYDILAPGFKYNMTDLQAALGMVQLGRLDEFQSRRREVVDTYNDVFGSIEELDVPVERAEVESALHLYVLRFQLDRLNVTRDEIIAHLAEVGVRTSVHFIPIHTHPFYREKYGYAPEDFPVANAEFERMISLPLNSRMSNEDVAYVIESVRDLVANARR